MVAIYNEFDPFAAAWLRELIKAGAIADGEVSKSDMWDVLPSDLVRHTQVHLCAGIGGWSAALRLAEWPDDRPLWTVSLPCQPFSAAGKGGGLADERGQLADAFFWLAGICRPHVIFGEQVEAAIKHDWWDVMASQLEYIGYTVGAVGFPASSVGAYHLRQRLYWVAQSNSDRSRPRRTERKRQKRSSTSFDGSPACGVADASGLGLSRKHRWRDGQQFKNRHTNGELGDSGEQGLAEQRCDRGTPSTQGGTIKGQAVERAGASTHFWADAEWIWCRDGKWRPIQGAVKSEFEQMVDGLSGSLGLVRLARRAEGEIECEEVRVYAPLVAGGRNRVGRLRGYGNAICVPAAAEFVKAFMKE